MPWFGRKRESTSAELLDAVYAASPFGFLVTDADTNMVRVNQAYLEITGLTEEQAAGKGHRRAVHPDDRDRVVKRREEHDPSQGTFEVEHRIQTPTGDVKTVRVMVTPIWHGKTHQGWFATMEDVTEHRKNSLELRASEEHLRAMSRASPYGLIVTTPDFRAYHVNERFTEITGLTADEALGMGHRNAVHPDDLDWLVAEIMAHDISTGTFEREHRIKLKDGTIKWVSVIVSAMYQEGELTGFVSTLDDVTADKAAEEKMRASEERFRAVTDDSPVGIIIRDSDDVVVYANRAIAAIIGQDVESLVGTNYQATVHHSDADDLSARLTEFLDHAKEGDGAVFRSKHRIVVGKTTKWVSTTTVPVYLSDGSVQFANEVHDITDQVEFEDLLRSSEERFRVMAESSPVGISIRDDGNKAIYCNQALRNMLNVSLDDMNEQWYKERAHPDDRDRVYRESAKFREDVLAGSDAAYRSEHRMILGGDTIWLEATISPIRYADGQIQFLTITQNVTERRTLVERIKSSEEKFRTMSDSSPIGIFTHDANGSCEYVNEAYCRINQIDPEQAMGKGWLELVRTDSREEAKRMWNEFSASAENSITAEIPGVRNGEEFWARTHTVKTWLDGKLTGYIGTYEDITAQKQAEHDIEAAKAAAESANEAKNEFLSRMSHELRTPLNTILGFAQLLEMESLPERQQESVANILYAGKHLLGLINDVLDIARIEDRSFGLDCALLDLQGIVEPVVTIMRPIAEEACVSICELEIEPGLKVYCDGQRMAQVLLNLVSNAVKYNVPNGTVTIGAKGDGGHVAITIADTGIGIPAEKLDQVFTPFDRLGAEHTDVEGSGLGLAVVSALIRAMAGEIELVSVEGSGTTATIRLPAHAPAEQELQPS